MIDFSVTYINSDQWDQFLLIGVVKMNKPYIAPRHAGNTYLSNGQTLDDFLNNYGTNGPTSFYEGKQFMKLLQEAERAAVGLGGYITQDFYDTVSGKHADRRAKDARLTIDNLHDVLEKCRKEIWDLTPPEEQFRLMLSRHDWYYSYSDDNRVWRAGEASWKAIQVMLKEHPEFQSILDAFKTERKL